MTNIQDKFEAMKKMTPYERANKIQDDYLLMALDKGFLASFISGMDGFGLEDSSELSLTRLDAVFDAIYKYHIIHPERQINLLVENSLISLASQDALYVYAAIDALQYQLEREARGTAAFQIRNPKVFNAIKEGIANNRDLLQKISSFKGGKYPNHLMGYAEDVDKQLFEQTGNRIL